MAATFGGIHFYMQWFKRLTATPEMVIAAVVIAVAIAFALWLSGTGRASSALQQPRQLVRQQPFISGFLGHPLGEVSWSA